MPIHIQREMQRLERLLIRWRVQLLLLRGVALLSGTLAVLGLLDVLLRTSRMGRWMGASLLLAAGGMLVTIIARHLRQHPSPAALAVAIERFFPELDNHLINYVQFSRGGQKDPLVSAYLKDQPPSLERLDVHRMKDVRAVRNSALAMLLGLLFLILPGFFLGGSWMTALARMVNPISDRAPITLTRILTVEPGDIYVKQGEPILLVANVQGARGHAVRVEVVPDDGRSTTYELGRLENSDVQIFSHRIARVGTRVRYRFRAGDAVPSSWYTVTPRPPPALTSVRAQIRPPEYMGYAPRTIDWQGAQTPAIPSGSHITVRAVSTSPLASLQLMVPGAAPLDMETTVDERTYEGSWVVEGPGSIVLAGQDTHGQSLEESLDYRYLADDPPVIHVIEPQGRVMLPPGETPQIRFRVEDDYAIANIHLERIERGPGQTEEVVEVQAWDPARQAVYEGLWRGTDEPRQTALRYRIVATDHRDGEPRVTRSEPILFSVVAEERQAEARDRLEAQASVGLAKIIALQEENLAQSQALRAAARESVGDLWQEPAARQAEIRKHTRDLLQNPIRPLGTRTEAVGRLYANEMLVVVSAMERVLLAAPDERARLATEVTSLQSTILRQLKAAAAAAEQAQVDRRKSGISAMLAALVEKQSAILERASGAAASLGERLADRQDLLSEDVGLFESACTREAISVRGNDAAFADLLENLARESQSLRIRQDMLLAAERFERGQMEEAMPLGRQARTHLQQLQRMLDEVGLQQEEERFAAMMEGLGRARERLQNLTEMHEMIREGMDTLRGHGDKDTEAYDVFLEEFVELVKKNQEALLEIPIDLHLFMDLNVGNELVEDVFSIFQEIEQAAGTENLTAEDVVVEAYAKNLEALEVMREMADQVDDIELWLMDRPENVEVQTEALDREEMPEDGIALGALAAQMDDLIGDLMEESEEQRDASQDGATTHAKPDVEMGWDVIEGDIATFSAKGKSGADVPDHKEQDGRSNVGRQGMAVGETAAGSGTISEGDDDIQERRTEDPTQSGMVQLDGEADTRATGGGKLGSGKADEFGMEGGARRMDSTEEGSQEGMNALMARSAEALFAQASLKNVRVDSLKSAIHHLRQADDAIARGDIGRVAEHRNEAAAALIRARAELMAPPSAAMHMDAPAPIVESAVQAGSDAAPPRFRTQVADYFKLLNEDL